MKIAALITSLALLPPVAPGVALTTSSVPLSSEASASPYGPWICMILPDHPLCKGI